MDTLHRIQLNRVLDKIHQVRTMPGVFNNLSGNYQAWSGDSKCLAFKPHKSTRFCVYKLVDNSVEETPFDGSHWMWGTQGGSFFHVDGRNLLFNGEVLGELEDIKDVVWKVHNSSGSKRQFALGYNLETKRHEYIHEFDAEGVDPEAWSIQEGKEDLFQNGIHEIFAYGPHYLLNPKNVDKSDTRQNQTFLWNTEDDLLENLEPHGQVISHPTVSYPAIAYGNDKTGAVEIFDLEQRQHLALIDQKVLRLVSGSTEYCNWQHGHMVGDTLVFNLLRRRQGYESMILTYQLGADIPIVQTPWFAHEGEWIWPKPSLSPNHKWIAFQQNQNVIIQPVF